MLFYLGTHKPVWLSRTGVPLFVSRRALAEYRTPPRARGPWALDSGGFSELSMFGEWRTTAAQYVAEVRRWREEVGGLRWAAVQDWMCEPFILHRTGRSLLEHQRRTVASWHELTAAAPEVPWVPVLQGWHPDDYLSCADLYAESGVDLAALPLVGVGSVCRRQGTEEALEVLRPLHALGLRLHGFGFKVDGLWNGAAYLLESADSMAWSRAARYEPPMPGCRHKTCANCMGWALLWRQHVLAAIDRGERNYQTVLL